MATTGPPLCPSTRCEEGALLLGVVLADGRPAFLPVPLSIDAAFVAKAREGRSPERRFRFAGPCREDGCRHWGAGRCGVADRVVALLDPPSDARLPRCAIRASCRWWAQSGPRACGACRFVVTDLTSEPGASS